MKRKRNSTYGSGRRCEVCGVILSIYNKSRECHSHTTYPDSGRLRQDSLCTSPTNIGQSTVYYNETGRGFIPD